MRTFVFAPAVGLVAAVLAGPPAVSEDKAGWVDLLGGELKDWNRVGTGKSPWRLTAEQTLVCAAATDACGPDIDFRDGTLEFEYRFRPTAEKTGYKASVSVRRTVSSPGCKLALGDDCGTVTGSFTGSSDRIKEVESKPAESPARPIGYWNRVRIRMEGQSVVVEINGKPAGSFDQCDVTHGLVYFVAEGSEIQFRRVRWKAAE